MPAPTPSAALDAMLAEERAACAQHPEQASQRVDRLFGAERLAKRLGLIDYRDRRAEALDDDINAHKEAA